MAAVIICIKGKESNLSYFPQIQPVQNGRETSLSSGPVPLVICLVVLVFMLVVQNKGLHSDHCDVFIWAFALQ